MNGSARRSVTLSFMVRLFNEGVVRIKMATQLSRARSNPIVNLHAHRKVRAVDQRAGRTDALYFIQFVAPAGCSFNQRHTRKRAGIHVSPHSGGDGKVDRHVATAESIREV